MSDAETDWYLRHRDGIEHGPFRLIDIVAAAKQGNVATDTCVRHETQTLGQWVFAQRVGPIAKVMPDNGAKQTPVRAARSASQGTIASQPASSSSPSGVARVTSTPSNDPPSTSPSSASPSTAGQPATRPEPAPIVRPLREQGYPVPKRLADACLAFFDFRFRSFVTPWIIKILWAMSVLGSVLWIGRIGYDHFVQGEVSANQAASALGVGGEWEFEPLGDQPFLESSFFQFAVTAAAIFAALLCIRVLCEAAIILLRAATDLSEIRNRETKHH